MSSHDFSAVPIRSPYPVVMERAHTEARRIAKLRKTGSELDARMAQDIAKAWRLAAFEALEQNERATDVALEFLKWLVRYIETHGYHPDDRPRRYFFDEEV